MSLMLTLTSIVSAVMASCDKDNDDKDTTKPPLHSQDQAGFVMVPINCDDYHRGDTIHFQYIFEDDVELGSFNIEIHNNFDGHSHSTETGEEHEHHEHHEHGDESGAWVFNQDYTIPAGKKSYTADLEIDIPEGISEGDYHFMLRVTDKTGWQEIKAVSIKIED